MYWKRWCAVGVTVFSLWASEAQATTVITFGNNPQPGDENVLLNTGVSGNPILGTTNVTDLTVRFTGTETLTAPASGQARIEAIDGAFTSLTVDIPDGSFESLILNLDAIANGTVDFTATTNTGVEFFNNVPVGGNGSNFFTFTTLHAQRLLSLGLSADVPLQFTDAAQFRIGGAQLDETSTPVPEPATMLMMGAGLAAIARRRLRRQA